MKQVVLGIRNNEKAKFLLDFLRQLDFVEIRQILEEKNQRSVEDKNDKINNSMDDAFLSAPVLSKDEIDNIEQKGKILGRRRHILNE